MNWTDMRARMDKMRAAKGLPPRTEADRVADIERLRAEARAFQLSRA